MWPERKKKEEKCKIYIYFSTKIFQYYKGKEDCLNVSSFLDIQSNNGKGIKQRT